MLGKEARTPAHAAPLELAESHNDLGGLYSNLGKFPDAAKQYQAALDLYRTALGPGSFKAAMVMSNVAIDEILAGDYQAAEELLLPAINIERHMLAPDPKFLILALANLGNTYDHEGRYQEAAQQYEEARTLAETTVAADHPLLARVLSGTAALYKDEGQLETAEGLAAKALNIEQDVLPPFHSLPTPSGCWVKYTWPKDVTTAGRGSTFRQKQAVRPDRLPPIRV